MEHVVHAVDGARGEREVGQVAFEKFHAREMRQIARACR